MIGVGISGGSGGGEQLVSVRQTDVEATYRFACSDEFIQAALNKVESSVFQGRLTVRVDNFGREIGLSDEHQSVVGSDWTDAAQQMNRYLDVFGYAVVRPLEHPRVRGEKLFHVVPWNKYELQFVESSQLRRRYFVNFNDASYPTVPLGELLASEGIETLAQPPKKSKTLSAPHSTSLGGAIVQIQDNENNRGYPLPDGSRSHLIFVRWPPTVNGYLQTPVSLLRSSMTKMRQMIEDEAYAGYWRARPLHVVSIAKNFGGGAGGGGGGTTGRETFGPGLFGEGDIKGEADRYRFERNASEHADFVLALEAANSGRQLTLQDKEQYRKHLYAVNTATHQATPDNPNSAIAPSDFHNIVLGMNQVLSQGPKPEGHPNFENLRELIMDMAFAVMNIQPAVVTPQRARFAADPQTTLREWDSALQGVQQNLSPMLVEIYRVAYAQSGFDHVNSVYKRFKVKSERIDEEIATSKRSSKQPGELYNPASTDGALSRREFEDLLRRNGENDLLRAIKQERKRTVKQQIAAGTKISFSFNHVPRNTLQELRMLYDQFVIDEDTYVMMAGRLAGIARDDILATEEDRKKERERRMKAQAAELENELKTRSKYAVLADGQPSKSSGSTKPHAGVVE